MRESLTPTDFRLLHLLNDPLRWFDKHPDLAPPQLGKASSRPTLIDHAMPDPEAQDRELMERYYVPLLSGGLVNGSLGGMMTAEGAWQPATTNFGREFLAFIEDPFEDDAS